MSSIKYGYTKVVAPDKLEFEVRNSNIAVALDFITSTATTVDVWFKATLSSTDESILTAIINNHVPVPLLYQGGPKDADNAVIVRPKAAKAGWAYQLNAINFVTSTLDGYHNNGINPATRLVTPLNNVILRSYDVNNTLLTEPPQMSGCVWTTVDWCPNFEMEIIGGTFYQNTSPGSDVFMWIHLAPGIVNFPFVTGGINLKMLGPGGQVQADGRVSKYMHPTLPMPGLNRFRITLKHAPGLVHEAQFMFEYFKPVS